MSVSVFGANQAINEGSSAVYTCKFRDSTGAPVAPADVSAIACWLKAVESSGAETTINSRSNQSVLNANGGTLGTGDTGFSLSLGALDTILVGADAVQKRRLTLKVTFTGGVLTHQIEFYVRALADIT